MTPGESTIASAPNRAESIMSEFRLDADGTGRVIGDWTTVPLGAVERSAQKARKSGALKTLDLSGLTRLDTNGALALLRLAEQAGADGLIPLQDPKPEHARLLEVVIKAHGKDKPVPEDGSAIGRILARLGETTINQAREALELLSFVGAVTLTILGLLIRPWRIRWKPLISQIEATGLNALPIVGLLNFLIGIVIAYQAANQLSKFGAQLLTVDSVGVGVLRELAVLITAIIIAGRSGSAFTAQIGSMQVNQEIDAMRAIGLNPLEVLCAPRIMALMISLPLLVFYAGVMGILGGAVAAMFALDITMTQFAKQLQVAVSIDHFWVGIVKAPVMAMVIATIGCFQGLKVSSNAESVGRRTTQSVVQGVFFVIAIDAVFSIFFLIIGV